MENKNKILFTIITLTIVLFSTYLLLHNKEQPTSYEKDKEQLCIDNLNDNDYDYYGCISTVTKEDSTCKKINTDKFGKESILECKDEILFIKSLKNKNEMIFESKNYNTLEFLNTYKAILNLDINSCELLEENKPICLSIINKNIKHCEKDRFCEDNFNYLMSFLDSNINYCENIKDYIIKVKCEANINSDKSICLKIVERKCNKQPYDICIESNNYNDGDYYRCLSEVNEDESLCDNINLEKNGKQDILRCKDEALIIKGLKEKKEIVFKSEVYNKPEFKILYKAILSSDIEACKNTNENEELCTAIIKKDIDECQRNTDCENDYYDISGIMENNIQLCNKITIYPKRITCESIVKKNPNNCLKITEQSCIERFGIE